MNQCSLIPGVTAGSGSRTGRQGDRQDNHKLIAMMAQPSTLGVSQSHKATPAATPQICGHCRHASHGVRMARMTANTNEARATTAAAAARREKSSPPDFASRN